MSPTDAELVARIRSGNTVAFETLMRRHFRMVFLVAFAQLGERADAEDVCQEVFVRCWERVEECRDPARVGAWMAGIARNLAHNRREYLDLRRADALQDEDHVAPGGTDAGAERAELRDRLRIALLTLPATQREVVLLHDLEGWTHAEIAGRLGVSELMSRRHLSDARRRLRARLQDLATLEHDHD